MVSICQRLENKSSFPQQVQASSQIVIVFEDPSAYCGMGRKLTHGLPLAKSL